MAFLRLLIFWYVILDKSNLSLDRSNQPACNSFVFIPNLSFFVLGFNVGHSKLIRLSFCHVLSWFANITNSKPNNLPICQSVTKHTYNIMPIYNKMAKYITNPNLRLLTKKLPIRGRRSWSKCTCLSWNTQQTHHCMCGNKDI